jgi:RHH-type transcriptional regulator, proline utilization regulon repressor / proline dehydrogenase / delta 1-pyrroline-5-carboxylate dehydrogenase
VRRLDENTQPGNFLTSLFDIAPDNNLFTLEGAKFRQAVADRHILDVTSRRATPSSAPGPRPSPIGDGEPVERFRNEPDTDFAIAARRDPMVAAVASWKPPTEPIPAVVASSEVTELPVVRVGLPASPHASYLTVQANAALVEAAVAAAHAAQAGWEALGWNRRAELIDDVGDVIMAHRGEIVAAMAHDAGKTIGEGDPEVSEAIDFARYYARSARHAATREADPFVESTPLGTVVVTPPWNFPYAIAMGGVLGALAAGSCVILKPAPQTVLTAWLVAQHCWEAGISRDVLQFVPCPDDHVGRRLVTHSSVDAVILTGARSTADMFLSWKPTMRLHAETSGKNSMIITASADLDLAIRDLVRSAFGHAGQKCSATSLAIIEAPIHDDADFHARLADAVRTLRVGSGWDPATDVGPLIDPPTGPLLRALTQLDPGETWLVEPRQIGDDPRIWSPGVKIGIRPDSWFARTECFGPVLGLIRATDLDDAITIANAGEYGLTAGLHTLATADMQQWTEHIEAGNLYINRGTTGAVVGRQPFGGWKGSVVGPTVKAGGPGYVDSLRRWSTGTKTLTEFTTACIQWADTWLTPTTDRAGSGTGIVGREIGGREIGGREIGGRDVGGLRAEANIYRVRPLPRGVAVRVCSDAPRDARDLVVIAATAAGCHVDISEHADEPDEAFTCRLASLDVDRLRLIGTAPEKIRAAAHRAGLPVYDDEPVTVAEIEMLRYTREQAISRTLHRHGNID